MKNKIQNSTILVLGSNPLSKKDLNYELLNLKYLPSIEQILALKPSLLIVNFNSYKAIYHSKLIELCEDLKSIYGLPIISIEDEKDQDLSLKETENQNLFEKIITRGGILAYILKSNEKTWYMQVLSSLFNFLKEESRKNPSLGLKDFIEKIDLLKETGSCSSFSFN